MCSSQKSRAKVAYVQVYFDRIYKTFKNNLLIQFSLGCRCEKSFNYLSGFFRRKFLYFQGCHKGEVQTFLLFMSLFDICWNSYEYAQLATKHLFCKNTVQWHFQNVVKKYLLCMACEFFFIGRHSFEVTT